LIHLKNVKRYLFLRLSLESTENIYFSLAPYMTLGAKRTFDMMMMKLSLLVCFLSKKSTATPQKSDPMKFFDVLTVHHFLQIHKK